MLSVLFGGGITFCINVLIAFVTEDVTGDEEESCINAMRRPRRQIWRSIVKSISPRSVKLEQEKQKIIIRTKMTIGLNFLQSSIVLLIRKFTEFDERAPEFHEFWVVHSIMMVWMS